jgi:membrane-associated phospholipid phosphatase
MCNTKIRTILFLPFAFLFWLESIAQLAVPPDTVPDSAVFIKKQKLIDFVPAAVAVTYGFAAINSTWLRKLDYHIYENTNKRHPGFHSSIDDYLRYVPAAAVYGLDLIGVKGKHNFADKTALLLLTATLTNGTVIILKGASNRMRPNKVNDLSFPSGHTATAFAAAEYLHQEYGDQSLWYSVGGYTVASLTGVFRLYRNYHWFSDVVAGAGLGVLSTKFAYLVYPSIKRLVTGNKKNGYSFLPVYQDQTLGLAFSGKF